MAKVADPLVGRAAELTAVDAAVAGLMSGGTASLLLAGEPGIGKTRLLVELAARANARGCLVLTGSASELERDLPFWVFVDALDEYVAGLDPRQLAALGNDVGAGLAQVLPSLADLAATGAAVGQDERYGVHRGMRALLERLAAIEPVVLVLDDVHWADAASVELLAGLLRQPPSGAVLLAMATRPRQVPERLGGAFERAQRRDTLIRLELRGLRRDEAADLLGDGVDPVRADAIYGESGGNPFYLQQLARSSGHPSGEVEITLRGVEVPRAVLASLAEEFALLAATERRALEGASVAGDPFEPELAAAAAGLDEPAVMEALDVLLSLDLVRPTDVPRRFRFRHPLVRRAVYESAPGGWLLGAHERCAAGLAERGASAAARAHHIEHAARGGDLGAVAVLREAADAALLRAPASAARWYRAALRVLPEVTPPAQRAELLMARARALASLGRLTDSRADLLAALELLPSEAVGQWVGITVACAGLEHLLGFHDQARQRLAAALERLPEDPSPEAVALMVELAVDAGFRVEYAAAHAWAERADAAARALADRPLRAVTSGWLATTAAFAGAPNAAEKAYDEAVALVAALSVDELASRPDLAATLAAAALWLDRYAEAVTHADRALALARATGHQSPTVFTTLALAWIMQGRLLEAQQLLDNVIERIREDGAVQGLAFHLVHRSLAALAAGDVDTALSTAEEATDLLRQFDEVFLSAWAAMALAAALVTKDPVRAERILIDGAGGEELPALPAGWRVMALELLARCRVALGQAEPARRTAALAEAAGVETPMAAAWAHRAVAAVDLDGGDPAAAAERALASATTAEALGAPVEAALARVLAGQALAAAGDADGAAAQLERAAAAFDVCGAPRHRAAAEQELRRLGRRVHRRTRPGAANADGLGALSERELQVAGLVVDRKTNPEIAAELFLSLKTVETHMRNIFGKLGVSSRVELARAVERGRRDP
jgi:ATP/maltotriose-dependent transcriptional regulator MalT